MTTTTLMIDLDMLARNLRRNLDSAYARLIAVNDDKIDRVASLLMVAEASAACEVVLKGLRPDDVHNADRYNSLLDEAVKLGNAYKVELVIGTRKNGHKPEPEPQRQIVHMTPKHKAHGRGGTHRDLSKRYTRTLPSGRVRVYLSEQDIRDIRAALDSQCGVDCTIAQCTDIATMYGVSVSTIWDLYKRNTYPNLK